MTTRRVNLNTESVDNYLKAIFALGGQEEERVTSNALAERLGVAPSSITNMLQKLASCSPALVEYERHRGVRLSSAGRRRALEVLRHHRLIETFLYEVLEYPLEEVHEEAERLEHFISERFEERIAAKLGHPKFDPHGHCIPAMDGKMPKQVSKPLTDIEEDEEFSCGQRFRSGCASVEAAQGSWHHAGRAFAGHQPIPGRICSTRRQRFEGITSLSYSRRRSPNPFRGLIRK